MHHQYQAPNSHAHPLFSWAEDFRRAQSEGAGHRLGANDAQDQSGKRPERSLCAHLATIADGVEALSKSIRDELGMQSAAAKVLHTWNQRLEHHPHIHALVPGIGPSIDSKSWVPCRMTKGTIHEPPKSFLVDNKCCHVKNPSHVATAAPGSTLSVGLARLLNHHRNAHQLANLGSRQATNNSFVTFHL